jgi:hypothetical protein
MRDSSHAGRADVKVVPDYRLRIFPSEIISEESRAKTFTPAESIASNGPFILGA